MNNMESTRDHEIGHDSLIAVQQRQQQELIKLLTQHFHNQFYQLACINQTPNRGGIPNNGASQFCSSSAPIFNPSSGMAATSQSSPINLNPYPPAATRGQSPNDQANLFNSNRGLDLSCLDMMAATTGANNHLQHLHHQEQQALAARSQQGNTIAAAAAATNQLPSSMDLPSMINPYQFSIMNALGLNGGSGDESNRLAISLRQQSIIQAISRQQQSHQESLMRSGDCSGSFGLDETQDRHRQQQQLRNQEVRNSKTDDDRYIQDDEDSEPILGGKSLLKFSINTILGRNSPQSYTQTDCEITTNQHSDQTSSGIEKFSPICNNQTNTQQFSHPARNSEVQDGERKRASIIEGDLNDSNSDSNSLPISTPVPQIDRSTSILLNQPLAIHHPRDDNSFSTTSSANGGVAPRNHQQQSLRHVPQAHLGGPHSLAPFLGNSTSFPWTVSSRGKPRRGMMRRAVFSDSQRVGLEKRFQMQKYISKPDRKKLAEKLGLRDSQVKIWFQNRRMKWRNSKERELLSAGGSREQTLPTRNNPNPDLSDVGETIRRLTSSSSASSTTTPLITPSNLTNK